MPEAERLIFARDPLARGLYAFYESHRTVFPMFSGTLKELMGRQSMQESKWLHALEVGQRKTHRVCVWSQHAITAKDARLGIHL